ncbi:hypothetical protein O6H91_08G088200 [Diphasiastrum complanatum]|uniref:Uncharacterized protein n=1 Tax=Diphasiastrum complanatum TaxID=34168 RepID=A0ACC2CZN9_DIPCM|nr:hypothetical protein O6H91_08G088200 [Diphasiastrum complanatum]
MDSTGSNGWSHDDHTPLSKWQLSSDILIAFAYFSIPLELVYFIYRSQTAELDLEVGKIRKEEETLRHVHFLTDEIRSSLDRNTILNTTLVEISRTLKLESCNIWMPKLGGEVLELKYKLGYQEIPPFMIPVIDETVRLVCVNAGATVVSSGSALARLGCLYENDDGHVAAVRLPLLSTASFNCSPKIEEATMFAIMVLELPFGRLQWSKHELELIEAVADQVVVALSHATVVEESMQARDLLIEKNIALECAKREAELAVVARNEFLAVMNHEMRTPMHAIIALSSLLRESKLTTEQLSMIDTISKSSSILSMLINDVLDFTRLEAGSLCLDPQAFQLSNFLKEAEELVTPMAQSKKLPLSMAIRGMIPSNVCADSNRILQVFLNVVGNSIKFTSEGHIKICVYVEDADSESMPSELSSPRREVKHMFLHFNVEDTGIGIKASDLQRLFHKFVQADSSITRNFGGSGLGLAIARKFVELMGGKIRLESEGLGKGSTCKFFVSLGVVTDLESETLISPKKLQQGSDLLGLKVLVVDDNAINRIVTHRLMETIGCKTTVTDSGQKCLEILMTAGPGAYQILLLDLSMPEMDGFTVTIEILKRFKIGERPLIIALTANSDAHTRQRCFDVGMEGVLTKPISLEMIKIELSALLENFKYHGCSS